MAVVSQRCYGILTAEKTQKGKCMSKNKLMNPRKKTEAPKNKISTRTPNRRSKSRNKRNKEDGAFLELETKKMARILWYPRFGYHRIPANFFVSFFRLSQFNSRVLTMNALTIDHF